MTHSPEEIAKAVALAKKRVPTRAIAKELGCSQVTVCRMLRAAGLKLRHTEAFRKPRPSKNKETPWESAQRRRRSKPRTKEGDE